jgi:hypothetical protein
MEVLNNVQLEGRRINVEISQNDGGGRRITEEVLVVVSEEVQLQEEKETLPKTRRFRWWV